MHVYYDRQEVERRQEVMLARMIRSEDEALHILCSDGTIIQPDKDTLNRFLTAFPSAEQFGGGQERWDREYPEMSMYPGTEIAFITDTFALVIKSFSPFEVLFEVPEVSPNNCISVAEYAAKHGKSVEQIKIFCRKGRIRGAQKVGGYWMIPEDAPYPIDRRFSYAKK